MANITLPPALGSAKIYAFPRLDGAETAFVQAVANVNELDSVYGSIIGNGQSVQANCADAGTAVIIILGAYTSVAVAFETSIDGTNWVPIAGSQVDAPAVAVASGTLSNTTRGWEFGVAGFNYIRARSTAYSAGTLNVQIGLTPFAVDPAPTAVLSAGAATIGAVYVTGRTTGGASMGKAISAATTNATLLKSSAGTIYGVSASNSGASWAYLKLYNKASAPVVGTDVPVKVIGIPPGQQVQSVDPDMGVAFATGISYAITAGAADNDTTAVALNQVVANFAYV